MKEQTVNDILSKKMQVKPLAEGESAQYCLVGIGDIDKRRTNEDTGEHIPSVKPSYRMAGKENVYDFETGQRVLIQNIVSFENKRSQDGDRIIQMPVVEDVLFRRGYFTCPWTAPETYAFLERSMKNTSNPFRLPGSRNVFFRVDSKKDNLLSYNNKILVLDAQTIVRQANYGELKRLADALSSDHPTLLFDYKDAMQLRNELFTYAEQNPRALAKVSEDKEVRLKLVIMDLERYGQITAKEEGQKLIWMYEDHLGGEVFAEIETTFNRYDALCNALNTNSIPNANKIINKLVKDHQALVTGISNVSKLR